MAPRVMTDADPVQPNSVVVLGAGGFIGGKLVRALAPSGSGPVVGAIRPGRDIAPLAGAEFVRCDVANARSTESALDGADFVVNCIGGTDRGMVATARALFAAARRMPPRRIVHLSSIAVYGNAEGVVNEDTALTAPVNHYGRAKRVCEQIVADYVHDGGDAVVLRPSCVHGPGSDLWTARLARLLRSGRIGDLGEAGDGVCNLIFIDDLVAAIIAALRKPGLSGETFILSDPTRLTWNEFLIRFAGLIGATPVRRLPTRRLALERSLYAPALRLARLAGRRGLFDPALVPDAITPSLTTLMSQRIRFSSAKADARLGVRRTELETALEAGARWVTNSAEGTFPRAHLAARGALDINRS